MKKLLLAATVLLIGTLSFGQVKHPVKKIEKKMDKYHDNIDNRMKGPNGEVVFIGPNGGRYYINAKGVRVYVYRGKKKMK